MECTSVSQVQDSGAMLLSLVPASGGNGADDGKGFLSWIRSALTQGARGQIGAPNAKAPTQDAVVAGVSEAGDTPEVRGAEPFAGRSSQAPEEGGRILVLQKAMERLAALAGDGSIELDDIEELSEDELAH
ncbi:MAG: hypothetical protein V1918_09780, partial [Planctomycetota bacterium]